MLRNLFRSRPAGLFSRVVLLVAAFGLGVALDARAQTTNGVITGVISDTGNGVLPGVTVTVHNTDTGQTRTTVSDSKGMYRIPALPPGTYQLTTELEGFGPVDMKDLKLTIDAQITQNLTLQIKGVSESLVVTGEAPVIETAKTDVSGVITQQQIDTLPLATRQPVALALLMPGTSQDAVRPRKFNANLGAGAFTNAGAFLIDGVWNKEPCTGEPRQNFPQTAIREFKVNLSSATAEYGWTASGVVTIATKSGTNLFNGEGFEYFRDKSLNAMNKFEQLAHDTKGAPKPNYRRNQFGGAFGGPVIKDRVHFFVSAERTKEDKYITVNTGKPQFYSALEGLFPIPEYDNTVFVRGDIQINPQQNVFIRYAGERGDYTCDACGGQAAAFSNDGIKQPRNSWAGAHTWVISSRALNEVRFQWSFYGYYPHPPGVDPPTTMYQYPASRTSQWTQTYVFPSLTWGTASSLYVEQYAREIHDEFSITTNKGGTHTWKFGGGITNVPVDDDVPYSPGTWTFATDQPFDGTAATMSKLQNPILFTAATPAIDRHLPNVYTEAYVADEWRPVTNVTLNLGLRYDYQAKVLNQGLNLSDKTMFPTTGTNLQIPVVDFQHRGDTNNLGPRLGVAWDVKRDGRSVVRAAYGRYFNPIFSVLARGEQTNFRQAAINIRNPKYPDPYGGADPLVFAATGPQVISVMANNVENGQSDAYNVGISQALSKTLALHVDVVYDHMTKLPLTTDINPRANGTTGDRPLPQFARIDEVQSIGVNNYKALLVRVEKRLEKRYQYLVSYTLAKGEGNIPFTGNSGRITDSQQPGLDWGPTANDRRHVLVASGAVMLPWNLQFGGVWTLRSSMPFNAIAGKDLNGDAIATDYVPGTTRAMGNRDNTTMLTAVNAWRALNGKGPIDAAQIESNDYNDVDVRMSKSLPLGPNRHVEVIAQVFNVFGRDNLAASGGVIGQVGVPPGWTQNALSDLFGRILQAYNRQQAELAVRFVF